MFVHPLCLPIFLSMTETLYTYCFVEHADIEPPSTLRLLHFCLEEAGRRSSVSEVQCKALVDEYHRGLGAPMEPGEPADAIP